RGRHRQRGPAHGPGQRQPEAGTHMSRSPRRAWQEFAGSVGPVGVVPLLLLLGLAAAERFDFTAYGVLGPEIRHAFHLDNAAYLAIAGAAQFVPLFLSVPIGFVADRGNRVQISRIGGLVWGLTAIGTGLAPALAVFVLFRIAGG